MQAQIISVEGIFNNGRELIIPFFQRGYVWEEDNWQRFLDSMLEIQDDRKPYFLGSVILKQLPIASGQEISDCRSVIDGQQRLTTICLFFKVLYNALSQQEIYKSIFFNRINGLILQHSYTGKEIFEAIINDNLTPELEKYYENNQILLAYKFFQSKLDVISQINPNVLLQYIKFVGIDLDTYDDEQQIFDTINSLGVKLTAAELLKNHLYPSKAEEKLYISTWQEKFEKDEETINFWNEDITAGRNTRNNLDVLLQSYFIILKKNSDKFKLDNLFNEYKKYITDNNIISDITRKTQFIKDLMDYSVLYKTYIDASLLDEDNNIAIKTPIQRLIVAIFALDITTLIPYVLYVLKEVENDKQDEIFKFLETYVMRCFICKVGTKNYNNLFASFISSEIKDIDTLKIKLMDTTADYCMPSDNDVKSLFNIRRKAHYIPKCILYLLELSIRNNGKHNTGLLSIGNYDLEHIMPQKWQNNWDLPAVDGKTKEELVETRTNAVATIGNMTILKNGLNKSLHNVSWNKKKSGNNGNDGLIKFGAGLETFSTYIQLSDWNEQTIQDRSKFLLEKALEVWKI